jgi:uncharacterized GH25 family protein
MINKSFRKALALTMARAASLVAVASVIGVSAARAHDFWIIPDMFEIASNTSLTVNGRQGGGKFPDGAAVPENRVVDARIIGAATVTKITDMSVEGASLRLRHKPAADGQYLIVVGLTSRVNRQTPAGTIRYLKLEGGEAEAARLEREQSLAGLDSVIFTGVSYAATVAQVGSGGPRAYGKTAGLALEFVPINDPGHLHVGDTMHVKMMGIGKPLANFGLELAYGLDSVTAVTTDVARITYFTDANGVAHLPLTREGPVLLRSAFASHNTGAAPREWTVARTTYVLTVGASH